MSITGAGLPPGITGNENLTPGAYGPVCSRCPIFSQCLKVCDLIENVIPTRQQQVVQLYYRESLQQQEIADRLKVTQQAVADALVRARRAVGKHFENREFSRNSGG